MKREHWIWVGLGSAGALFVFSAARSGSTILGSPVEVRGMPAVTPHGFFSAPRAGPPAHSHQGVDLAAPPGSRVLAVGDGVIVATDPGLGKLVRKLRLDTPAAWGLGHRRVDEIGVSEIAQFRAKLVKDKLSGKRVNNILAVLSKPLRYASDVGLITAAPRVGLIKVERPEFVCWDFDEYARILAAAREDSPEWYAAVCLAGEAGLRAGEIRALRWKEDVDMIASTITVNQQIRQGMLGTPKGRTRRTVPMTETLRQALRNLAAIGGGYVLRNADGGPKTDGQTGCAIHRIYDRAGFEERDGGWHVLRHSFGTHAALFGVNP